MPLPPREFKIALGKSLAPPPRTDQPDPSSSPIIFLDLGRSDADGTSSKKYTVEDEHVPS